MANNSLSHHLLLPLAAAGGDDDDSASSSSSSAAVTFPSFWPPFPSLLSDSDSDAPFPPRRMDRCVAARQDTAAAFLGLDFHDEDYGADWDAPDEAGLPLCWDCLQLEEHDAHQRWDLALSDSDEWEQVAVRGHEEAAEPPAPRSIEWEVLLAANSLGGLMIDEDVDGTGGGGIETYFLDGGADDDDDGMLFGQLAAEAEHEPRPRAGARRRRPPWRASRRWWSRRPTRSGAARSARCARTASRPARAPGGCRARTSTTTPASCRGSPSATRARCAATSCPPTTPTTRSGRPGGPPATGTASPPVRPRSSC
uniref:Predicted protein n=1 Tax=Hordeum vulgare subsp. vulgare TaxID=112509 RepID=F2D3F6_HORVV|nr:predicted protein [Hordeum vulgare subsp. vulgare]